MAGETGENRSASIAWWLVYNNKYITKGNLSEWEDSIQLISVPLGHSLTLGEEKEDQRKRLNEAVFSFKQILMWWKGKVRTAERHPGSGQGEMPWLKVLQCFPYLSALFLNTQSLCLSNTSLNKKEAEEERRAVKREANGVGKIWSPQPWKSKLLFETESSWSTTQAWGKRGREGRKERFIT